MVVRRGGNLSLRGETPSPGPVHGGGKKRTGPWEACRKGASPSWGGTTHSHVRGGIRSEWPGRKKGVTQETAEREGKKGKDACRLIKKKAFLPRLRGGRAIPRKKGERPLGKPPKGKGRESPSKGPFLEGKIPVGKTRQRRVKNLSSQGKCPIPSKPPVPWGKKIEKKGGPLRKKVSRPSEKKTGPCLELVSPPNWF